MSKITNKHLAQTLYELTKDKSKKELDDVLKSYSTFLVENGYSRDVNKILDQYELHDDLMREVQTITIESAFPLTAAEQKKVCDHYAKDQKVTNVESKNVINKNLLGGYKITYKDIVYDYSVNGKIQQLHEHLTNN